MMIINKDLRTFKFSKTKLDKLKYSNSDKDIVYHDTDSYCLKLRVTKNQKTFYFIRKLSNRTKKVKIGLFSHQFNDLKLRELITVENARKINSQIKTKIEKGEEFSRKDNTLTEAESFTVDDAMEQFIELFEHKHNLKLTDPEKDFGNQITNNADICLVLNFFLDKFFGLLSDYCIDCFYSSSNHLLIYCSE